MPLTREEIEHVAKLARLSLRPDEIQPFCDKLSTILGFVEKLGALDVKGVEPTTHAVEVASTPLRDDVPRPSLPVDEALANAPAREGTHFSVPRIIE